MATNYLDLAAQLRQQRSQEQAQRQASMPQQAPVGGGIAGGGSMFAQQQPQQPQNDTSLGSSVLDGLRAYNESSKGGLNRMLGGGAGGGAFTGASPAAMSAMEAGGGSSLGSMALGGSAPAAGLPAAAGANPVGMLAMGAKALNDTGVSSYGNTLKGQWAGNITDQFLGDRDKTGAVGNMAGAIGNFFGGDFGGGFDRAKSSLKDIFKLKLF